MWRSWAGVDTRVRPVGRTAKLSKTMLKVAYVREMNIQFSGNIPAVSMPIASSLKICHTMPQMFQNCTF